METEQTFKKYVTSDSFYNNFTRNAIFIEGVKRWMANEFEIQLPLFETELMGKLDGRVDQRVSEI